MAVDPVTALDRVLHLATLVGTDLARFERETGLSTSRIHVLWTLAGGPTTQQSVAVALGVTPRTITGLVDGLVASGHVSRQPHPTDRRATLVTPTATGERLIRDLVEGHEDLARQLFGDVPGPRLATFVAVLEDTIARFARLLEEAT